MIHTGRFDINFSKSYRIMHNNFELLHYFVPRKFIKVSKSQRKKISLNSIAQKMNKILDKTLPYEARPEFCQIFCLFFGQWSFKKNTFEIYSPLPLNDAGGGVKMTRWVRIRLVCPQFSNFVDRRQLSPKFF